MKIRNHFNYDPSVSFETVVGPSMAVPDQSYTVKELFERMVRGLPLDDRISQRATYYDDDEDIDNPDPTQRPDFDLTDYDTEMSFLRRTVADRKAMETSVDEHVSNDLNDKTSESTDVQ